jgi:hypothetical protein
MFRPPRSFERKSQTRDRTLDSAGDTISTKLGRQACGCVCECVWGNIALLAGEVEIRHRVSWDAMEMAVIHFETRDDKSHTGSPKDDSLRSTYGLGNGVEMATDLRWYVDPMVVR